MEDQALVGQDRVQAPRQRVRQESRERCHSTSVPQTE